MADRPLTDAQARMLADVRRTGRKVYNARAKRTINALILRGLVKANWDLVLHGKGDATWRITVTPVVARDPNP